MGWASALSTSFRPAERACLPCPAAPDVPFQCQPPGRTPHWRFRLDGRPVAQGMRMGGFAEQMLVHENGLVKIDRDMPLDRASVLDQARYEDRLLVFE